MAKGGSFSITVIDIFTVFPARLTQLPDGTVTSGARLSTEELLLYPLYNMPAVKICMVGFTFVPGDLRNAGYTQTPMRRFVLNPAPSVAAESDLKTH